MGFLVLLILCSLLRRPKLFGGSTTRIVEMEILLLIHAFLDRPQHAHERCDYTGFLERHRRSLRPNPCYHRVDLTPCNRYFPATGIMENGRRTTKSPLEALTAMSTLRLHATSVVNDTITKTCGCECNEG